MDLCAAAPPAMRADGPHRCSAQSCNSKGDFKLASEVARRVAASSRTPELHASGARVQAPLQSHGSKSAARFVSQRACSMSGSTSLRCSIVSHLGQRHTLLSSQQTLDTCIREFEGSFAAASCSSLYRQRLAASRHRSCLLHAAEADKAWGRCDLGAFQASVAFFVDHEERAGPFELSLSRRGMLAAYDSP